MTRCPGTPQGLIFQTEETQKMPRFVRAGLIAAAIAVATLAQARDFRSADVHPTDYPTVEAVRHMGNLLKEQTKGKLGVKVYPSGALGAEKDTIEQLKIGGPGLMRIHAAPLYHNSPPTIAISVAVAV